MYREKIERLREWKHSRERKPLVLTGARQVGKTWLLKQFGEEEFENVVYVNFEENSLAREIFEADFDTRRIITELQALKNADIVPDKTLIILDEAQEAPRAITAMKYFCENAPEYYICVAGSLLGLAIHKNASYPVGKVDEMSLYPLTFGEFLRAVGEQKLAELLEAAGGVGEVAGLKTFHPKLLGLLKTYFYVGGMPSVVKNFVETNSWIDARAEQKRLLRTYENDFGRYSGDVSVIKIMQTWESIPTQLARENRKFLFGLIREGARARAYEAAVNWLRRAGLAHTVHRVTIPRMPLIGYKDYAAYKIYHLDIGLLGAMADLDEKIILEQDRIFTEYKGAMTEQFVAQELTAVENLPLYYWTSEEGRAEVDFVVQVRNQVVPIEVKPSVNLQAKSLRTYAEKFAPGLALRVSMADFRESELGGARLLDLPLYWAREAVNLLKRGE